MYTKLSKIILTDTETERERESVCEREEAVVWPQTGELYTWRGWNRDIYDTYLLKFNIMRKLDRIGFIKIHEIFEEIHKQYFS